MYVDRAMYSLRMSFWTVPRRSRRGTPRASPAATYSARRMDAVALIVMLVLTSPSGMPLNSMPMSSIVETGTPTLPTSPRTKGSSGSYPICVGRSNATLRPVVPWSRRYRYRAFDSSADPKPAYSRIVQRRPRYIVGYTPRVNGGSPGNPRSRWYSRLFRSPCVYRSLRGTPLNVLPSDAGSGGGGAGRDFRRFAGGTLLPPRYALAA